MLRAHASTPNAPPRPPERSRTNHTAYANLAPRARFRQRRSNQGEFGESMTKDERIGVLVGWSSRDLGPNVMLELQTFERDSWDAGEEPDTSRFFLTRNQATLLANHLLQVSGAQRPPRRRGWLAGLFG